MLITNLLLLCIPAAGILGYQYGYKRLNKHINKTSFNLPADYFIGINYLIDEQPDKAVDIFIKMLEVNADTFETHLALGNLFRRRGEVDKAIRIHQNLIAKPNLTKSQRIASLSELGQDYLKAGVLDRAEKLFLELISLYGTPESFQHLLNIYQQQKDWEKAIQIAKKIQQSLRKSMHQEIAHYFCELAELLINKNQFLPAQEYLKNALSTDSHCVRAGLMLGKIAMANQQYKLAIRYYKQIKNQDPDFIVEMLIPLATCFEKLNLEKELNRFLYKCLEEYPQPSIALVLTEYIKRWQGTDEAIQFITSRILVCPSLQGLTHLTQLFQETANDSSHFQLTTLNKLLQQLLANKPIYRCTQCGFSARMLYWLCPQCRQWNCVKPIHSLEVD